MLGLWERPRERVFPQHFAFEVGLQDLPNLVTRLEQRGIEFRLLPAAYHGSHGVWLYSGRVDLL